MDQLDFLFMWRPWQPITEIGPFLYILPSLGSNSNMKNYSDYENPTQIIGQDQNKTNKESTKSIPRKES